MDVRLIVTGFSASPNVTKEDLPAVAEMGFRSVISNRLDGEDPGQASAHDMGAAAAAVGLEFVHIPVAGAGIGDAEIAALQQALATMPGPVLGFCRSGMRTTALWALAQSGRRSPDDILRMAAGAGFDLSPIRPRLDGMS